ncbi:hypothetical protein [Niallia taxi]|uniref:hypothetical protein n=1 Tax=Niallia taxi TaxID=2499688 RepID=UPI0015F390D8|nr:hypothetical protein [Niallia taxi]
MRNHTLLLVEMLQFRFGLKEGENQFEFEVKIQGVKDMIRLLVSLDMILNKYAAIRSVKLLYSSVNIGDNRKILLNKEVAKVLTAPNLYLPGKVVTEGYVWGHHNIDVLLKDTYRSSEQYGKAYLAKVIQTKDLELLATHSHKERENEPMVEESYYFYNGKFYRTLEGDWYYKYLTEGYQSGGIEGILPHISFENAAIDENGTVYRYVKANDPDNIRLIPNGTEENGSTLTEYLAEKGLSENLVLPHFIDLKVSYGESKWNIHSERVVGQQIPVYEVGQWIEHEGKYGKVIEQQGPLLSILWEDQYRHRYNDLVPFHEVSRAGNVHKQYAKPCLVKIRTKTTRYTYGWLLSETPNYKHVQPINLEEARIQQKIIDDVLGWRRRTEEADLLIAKIEEQWEAKSVNFFIYPNDEIEKVKTKTEAAAVKHLLLDNKDFPGKSLVNNIFEMKKLRNKEFFIVHFLMLLQKEKNIMSSLDRLTIYLKDEYFSEAGLDKWFQRELEISNKQQEIA